MMMILTLLMPLMMVGAIDSQEEHSLQCSSLPSFDNSDIYLYFGCSCQENEKLVLESYTQIFNEYLF